MTPSRQHLSRQACPAAPGIYTEPDEDPYKAARRAKEAERLFIEVQQELSELRTIGDSDIATLISRLEPARKWEIRGTHRSDPDAHILDSTHRRIKEFTTWQTISYLQVMRAILRSHQGCERSGNTSAQECLSTSKTTGHRVGEKSRDALYYLLGQIGWLGPNCAIKWSTSSFEPLKPGSDPALSKGIMLEQQDAQDDELGAGPRSQSHPTSEQSGQQRLQNAFPQPSDLPPLRTDSVATTPRMLHGGIMKDVQAAMQSNVLGATNQLALDLTREGNVFLRLIPDLRCTASIFKSCLQDILGAETEAAYLTSRERLIFSRNGIWIEGFILAVVFRRTLEDPPNTERLMHPSFERVARSELKPEILDGFITKALQDLSDRKRGTQSKTEAIASVCGEVWDVLLQAVPDYLRKTPQIASELKDQEKELASIVEEMLEIALKLDAANLRPARLTWPKPASSADPRRIEFRDDKGAKLDSYSYHGGNNAVLFSISPVIEYVDRHETHLLMKGTVVINTEEV